MADINTKDYIVTATAADAHIRAFACTTKNISEESRRLHNTSPVMSAALGRTLTAAAMMSIMMKGDGDKLTIQIKSDGPSGGLTVCADSHGNVKGYTPVPDVIVPAHSNGHLGVSTAIGNGDDFRVKRQMLKQKCKKVFFGIGNDNDWYPGDEYVDIVGRDLYGNDANICYNEYRNLYTTYGKIIALSECGFSEYTNTFVAGIEDQWNAGAKWSWFMPWYTTDFHAPQEWWGDFMNSDLVITRDEVNF